jgi:hypothetical protein
MTRNPAVENKTLNTDDKAMILYRALRADQVRYAE